MATVNGMHVRIKDDDGTVRYGILSAWHEQSAWVKVTLDDGTSRMIHESEPLELSRVPFNHES